jgi:hypothetical protein
MKPDRSHKCQPAFYPSNSLLKVTIMKNFRLSTMLHAIFLLIIITSCTKNDKQLTSDSLTPDNTMYPRDSIGYATDWSDSVEVVIIDKENRGQHVFVDVSVPPDFVLIGGGAVVLEQMYPDAALLTASYPDNNLSTWHAASKDHRFPFPHTLRGFAIGLKLKGLSRDELKKCIRVFTNTSGTDQYPNTEVSVGDGYNLIGGGAKINWSGEGNLLVKSIPKGMTW